MVKLTSWVTHYIPEYDTSINWPNMPTFNTVLEYNSWKGRPGDNEEVERVRRVVLMETNHEAILRVNQLIIEGDKKTLLALLKTKELDAVPGQQAVLGYDFQRNEPKILLYLS